MKNLKKIILASLMLLVCLGLSACGDEAPPLEERVGQVQEGDRVTYEGTLEKAASSAYSQGTHRIITETGAYLVQSSTVNLNNYEGKEIILSGTLEKGMTAHSEKVLSVDEIKLTSISFESAFVEYESDRYDFALEHPETWTVGETEVGVVLMFENEPWVNINVYNNQDRLDTFVPQQEEGQGVEVTVAHQRAIRFNDTDSFRLYVEHPPTNRIYRIRFDQAHFSDSQKQPLFYEVLETFELLYNPQIDGPECGGPEAKECAEDYRCELSSASIEAVGICVPISGGASPSACPYIAPPSCPEYRVAEYNSNSCPLRYECLDESLSVFESVELAEPLPTVDQLAEGDTNDPQDDLEPLEENPDETNADPDDEGLEQVEDPKTYTVPSVESVMGQYTSHSGLSINYPEYWWFSNFGVQGDGIGFAPVELESIEEAVMVLKVGSGDLTREVDGVTYGISGPDDLSEVMQAILDSIEVED